MITDGTFTFSTKQDLLAGSTNTNIGNPMYTTGLAEHVTLATNYYDASEVGDSGGRVVYVHVHVDEAITTVSNYVDFRLLAWPNGAVPQAATVANGVEVSSLLVAESSLTKGADLYLPVPVSSISSLAAATRPYRYLSVTYHYGITAVQTGKVTTTLTDAITNKPRIFSAKNST